ncbi:signal transduction histidine kinase [Kitasatospora sp. GAS204A]|uniref:sensor histidine kinase n=1 Tax=unclassified Kitasatospora TaxID=2633591 RepID=UPI00247645BF|nr:histidine kinase [Kitasatospora sp. GAS204B]MDH6120685.1 signal transduction histidine kinase [Kitasatospora sp. GAS204B]
MSTSEAAREPSGRRSPIARVGRWFWRPERRWHAWAVDVLLVIPAALDALLNFPPPRDWRFLISLGAAAVLLLRRRFPRTVLLLTLPGLYAGNALLAAMIAAYTVARTERAQWQKALVALAVVVGSFIPWPISGLRLESWSDITQHLIFASMLGTGPVMLGLLAQTRLDLSARVAELAELRDHERALYAKTVIAEERARIAREMHDVVSHQAGLIAVQAGALQVTTKDPATRETAGILRGLAVATLEELRSMIIVLRAAGAGPTELAPQPRLADLARLVAAAEVDAVLRVDGCLDGPLPEPVERAAYRTAQEALTNVRKHAPGAPTEVLLRIEPDCLRVTVRNAAPSGPRTEPELPGGHHGLIGLRERACILGGTIEAGPEPDGGFAVRLWLPLPARTEPAEATEPQTPQEPQGPQAPEEPTEPRKPPGPAEAQNSSTAAATAAG